MSESCLPEIIHVVDMNEIYFSLHCPTSRYSRRIGAAWGTTSNSLTEFNCNGPRKANIHPQSIQESYLKRLKRSIIRDAGNEPQLSNNVTIELTIYVLYKMNLS